MFRSTVSRVMWVGRATVFLVGLAVIVALVVGVASTALGANGDFFRVGKSNNLASAVSVLTKSGAGPALSLRVGSGAPLAVNSDAKVDKLNADKLDGKEPRQLPGAVVATKRFAGELPDEFQQAADGRFLFNGPTVQLTTNGTQRLVAAADAAIGTSSGTVFFEYGMCYAPAGQQSLIRNFVADAPTGDATVDRASFSPTATVVPGAGVWEVGFCARYSGLDGPDGNDSVSGWVQVVNQ